MDLAQVINVTFDTHSSTKQQIGQINATYKLYDSGFNIQQKITATAELHIHLTNSQLKQHN